MSKQSTNTPAAPVVAAVAPEVEQAPAEAGAKAAKTKKVTFLRTHPNYAYWPGDKAEIEAEAAKALIEGNFAE